MDRRALPRSGRGSELVEVLGDLSCVVRGTDDLSRRLSAGHAAALPADGDDHPPVAGDLQGIGQKPSSRGFGYNEMIAYLLLTNISRMFSSMPGLAGGIAREIREGTMKRYMIQPIDLIGYLLVYRVAHKVTYIIASFIALFSALFPVPRLFRRVSRLADAGCFRRIARAGVPGRLLLRGVRRDGGVLVSRSHVACFISS